MKTHRLSTINYYSEGYLVSILRELCDANPTLVCYFVHHTGEGQDKDHNHVLFIDDCNPVDSNSLYAYFRRKIEGADTKTQATPRFQKTSDVNDWFAYGVHDRAYLAKKGLTREYAYTYKSVRVVTADGVTDLVDYSPAAVTECRQFIDGLVVKEDGLLYALVQAYATRGVPFSQFVAEVHPAISKVHALREVYGVLLTDSANRADKAEREDARRRLGLNA